MRKVLSITNKNPCIYDKTCKPSILHRRIVPFIGKNIIKVLTGQQTGGSEVDFVARKDDNVVYVQSSYLMSDESTRRREFGNLQAISNNYPKYVVSLDEWTSGSNVDGIRHVHLGEFLQMNE